MRLRHLIFLLGACMTAGCAYREPVDKDMVYVVDEIVDEDLFVIGGEEYEASTTCLGWQEGDRIAFVNSRYYSNRPDIVLNLRTRERCEVIEH